MRSNQFRFRLPQLSLIALLLAMVAAPTATAAANTATITSPKADTVYREDGRIVARVTLASRAVVQQVRINGAVVAGSAINRTGRIVTITLTDHRAVRRGYNTLRVKTQLPRRSVDVDHVRFIVARTDRRLLTTTMPVRVRTRAHVQLTATARGRHTHVDVWVNNRKQPAEPANRRTGRLVIELSAHHGLRHGANSIRVVATDAVRGLRDVELRTVKLDTRAPIASAGADARARVGSRIGMSAKASKAPSAGPKSNRSGLATRATMTYAWTIVEAPAGSVAQLKDATTETPYLDADLPGRYTLQVTTTYDGLASTDTIDVDIVPPPMQQVQIIGGNGAPFGISVGGRTTSAPAPPNGGEYLQATVLARATLETCIALKSFGTDAAGIKQLATAVNAARCQDELLVITAPVGVGAGQIAAVRAALVASLNDDWGFTKSTPILLDAGAMTVAISGAHSGTADAGDTIWSVPGSGKGGWFVESLVAVASNSGYVFAAGDYITYELHGGSVGAGLGNTVSVGRARYVAPTPPTANGGFQLVRLDDRSLTLVGNDSFATNATTAATSEAEIKRLTASLSAGATAGDLMLLATLGTRPLLELKGTGAVATAALLDQIELAGGTPDAVIGMTASGSQRYALIGGGGIRGAETGTVILNDPSQHLPSDKRVRVAGDALLSGVLERQRDGAFIPMLNTQAGKPDWNLVLIAYQDPVAWPLPDTAGRTAAWQYVAQRLARIPGEESAALDPRARYSDANFDPGVAIDRVNQYTIAPPAGETRFTTDDLTWVKQTLTDELTALGGVRQLFDNMQKPVMEVAAGSASITKQVTDKVEDAVNPPNEGSKFGWVHMVQTGLAIASVVAPEYGPALTGTSMALGMTESLGRSEPNQTAFKAVKAKAKELANQLPIKQQEVLASYAALEGMVSTDYGKLIAVGDRVNSTGTGAWKWGRTETTRNVRMLNLGTRTEAYSALMPIAYWSYVLSPGSDNNGYGSSAGKWTCSGTGRRPWRYAPDLSVVKTIVPGKDELRIRALGIRAGGLDRNTLDGLRATNAPGSLTKPLWQPFDIGVSDTTKTGVGLWAPRFVRTAFQQHAVRCVNVNSGEFKSLDDSVRIGPPWRYNEAAIYTFNPLNRWKE